MVHHGAQGPKLDVVVVPVVMEACAFGSGFGSAGKPGKFGPFIVVKVVVAAVVVAVVGHTSK